MLDIKFVRENKELVKENIKKKFQDKKLPLVDEVLELDEKIRSLKQQGDSMRKDRNTISSEIGSLMRDKKVDEANERKQQVVEINKKLVDIEKEENVLNAELRKKMLVIPQIIDSSVPIGKDDSENVSHLFQVMKFHIMQIFANHYVVLIKKLLEEQVGMVFII